MSETGAIDVARLERIVGPMTLARGRRYARDGAVEHYEWDESGRLVVGEVHGSAAHPYRVAVQVTRVGPTGISSFEGRCTCPVGHNCKHAVAVLLASEAPARTPLTVLPGGAGLPRGVGLPATRESEPDTNEPAAWERALRGLLEGGRRDEEAGTPGALGLQFELVATRPAGRGPNGPGIRVRPVTRSDTGRWVRSGISWSRVEYLTTIRRMPAPVVAQAALLRELRALHALGLGRGWAGYGEEVVWLEAIPTRRLWDLLAQARDLGIPLLRAGRAAESVRLEAEPVEAVLDIGRAGDGLVLRPQLVASGVPVAPTAALLVGRPAHGVAWWSGPIDAAGELHLAALSTPVDTALERLVVGGPLAVPAADAERLLRDLYPALRRRMAVRSSDGSVELPEALEDELVLALAWHPGARATLAWSLRRDGESRPVNGEADRAAEAARAEAVGVVAGLPGLVEARPAGACLVPRATLFGLTAARFCLEVLPELAQLEALVVDESGERPDFKEVTEAPVVRLAGEESPDGDWLDLAVEVRVGDEEVPFHELFVALAAEQSHLVLPSGTFFSLDRPELRRLAELIAEARALNDSPRATARLSRYQASLWEDLSGLGAASAEVGQWRAAVEALSRGDAAERPLPAGLQATLRPYQLTGFQWLAARYEHRLGGILADDMGLGKTLQALALICHARERGLASAPFLVVAPTSVVPNWVSETARFAPEVPVVAISETASRRGVGLAEAVAGSGLVVTSYALFRLENDAYAAQEWAGILFDEAQFVKNPATQVYRCARRVAAPFKLAMSGTPLENSLAELWALTSLTAPGLFPSAERFAKTYRAPIERQRDAERLEQLRRRIRPVLLRRRKEDVATDLPDKQEQVMALELHPRHRKLYQTYLQRERQKVLGMLGDLDGNRFEILRSLTLLRQAALDVSLVDDKHAAVPSTKLDALGEMLEEIVADGHRVLVFSQFTRFLAAARRRADAAGLDSCYLDGSTTKRAAVIGRFRAGDAPVFFISLKAGGFGLNLTEADYCILLDPWWNPATEAQAIDRIHRIGQTRKVLVYRLVATDTIEEKVMALKERKAQLFASVVDGGGFESAALTVEDVRALLD